MTLLHKYNYYWSPELELNLLLLDLTVSAVAGGSMGVIAEPNLFLLSTHRRETGVLYLRVNIAFVISMM